MDESSLEASLELYKTQLAQVDQALQAAGDNEDLVKLKSDLQELIDLTQDGLLSLKKSNILKSIDDSGPGPSTSSSKKSNRKHKNTASSPKNESVDEFDSEWAAFQDAIKDDSDSSNSMQNERADNLSEYEPITKKQAEDETSCDLEDINELNNLIGTRCRAPFVHSWGSTSYYNAIVTGIDQISSTNGLPKVHVMFCNPTHTSMLPCEFYLDSKCKFTDENCKYSHGYSVDVEELREFQEPDYSILEPDAPCLAKYDDGIWYRAVVQSVDDDHQVILTYESYDETVTMDLKDVLPLDKGTADSDMSSDDEDENIAKLPAEEDSDDDVLPVFLWKPPKTTQALGEWETHTKGIGSKLMAKMGYITGQGLGRDGQGKAEPVPIQLLPQGKSLDKIMELKEIAGEQDLFDVMKKLEKKKKKEEKKQAASYQKSKTDKINVFDFINKKLGGKKGNIKDFVPKHHVQQSSGHRSNKHISESDLHKRSDRTLNVQLLKTHEEIKNVEKEVARLKQSLLRHEGRDKGMVNHTKSKIAAMEQYLQKLSTSEQTIQNHKQKRSNHKKLTIF